MLRLLMNNGCDPGFACGFDGLSDGEYESIQKVTKKSN